MSEFAPGKPRQDEARHDFSEKRQFAYRYPSIRGTGPEWLRPQGDGSVCFDVDMAYGDCDLRLRGDTLLLMQVDEGKRFKFNFELGVKP